MRGKFALVVLFTLFASSAFAGNTPVPVYTFVCNGNAKSRVC